MGKPTRQPVYLRAKKVIDPETGAEISALVPHTATDYDELRQRGLVIGNVVRGQLTRPRNVTNHRRAHALGKLVQQNIEGFESLAPHAVLKELQRRSGVACEVLSVEVPGVGTLGINKPETMAFDLMDEGAFAKMMHGLCRYIALNYWPDCEPEQIEQMAELMGEQAG